MGVVSGQCSDSQNRRMAVYYLMLVMSLSAIFGGTKAQNTDCVDNALCATSPNICSQNVDLVTVLCPVKCGFCGGTSDKPAQSGVELCALNLASMAARVSLPETTTAAPAPPPTSGNSVSESPPRQIPASVKEILASTAVPASHKITPSSANVLLHFQEPTVSSSETRTDLKDAMLRKSFSCLSIRELTRKKTSTMKVISSGKSLTSTEWTVTTRESALWFTTIQSKSPFTSQTSRTTPKASIAVSAS